MTGALPWSRHHLEPTRLRDRLVHVKRSQPRLRAGFWAAYADGRKRWM